jgi:hypothetical protein
LNRQGGSIFNRREQFIQEKFVFSRLQAERWSSDWRTRTLKRWQLKNVGAMLLWSHGLTQPAQLIFFEGFSK